MKIKIIKTSGAEVELSDVAGIEVVEAGTLAVSRFDPFELRGRVRLEMSGDGIEIRDHGVTWPRKDVPFG